MRRLARRPDLLGWLGVGLAIRFLLMPWAVSADFLAVYWRSNLIATEGVLFGTYLVNMGAHYLHALALLLLSPLLPPAAELWGEAWLFDEFIPLGPQVIREFAAAAQAPQTLFALKLPYLVADLAAGLLLLSLVAGAAPHLVRRAWAFWMLSPIGLYASYVFSRYEAFPVVFVVAALWCVERRRPWWGALLLGAAITMRTYPLLLVPVFAVCAVRGLPRQAAWVAAAVAPFAAVMASNRLLAGTVGELARLADFPTGNILVAYRLGPVPVFPVFLLAVLAVLGLRTLGWRGWQPETPQRLWLWLLVVHAGLFALTPFSAHYFMWFTPFVALAIARWPESRGAVGLHLVQAALVLLVADLRGGPVVTLALFEPLHPVAVHLPSLRGALHTSPELSGALLALMLVAFALLMLAVARPAVAELARPAEPGEGEAGGAGEQRGPGDAEGGHVGEPARPTTGQP